MTPSKIRTRMMIRIVPSDMRFPPICDRQFRGCRRGTGRENLAESAFVTCIAALAIGAEDARLRHEKAREKRSKQKGTS